MFATDPTFQIYAGGTPFFDTHFHQLSNPITVDGLEGIQGQDTVAHIFHQEVALSIIPAVAKGELGQVVGPKGEELRSLCDLVGGQPGAGDLDHRTELI